MNLRYLMALPLAATLIIPAAAQQANSAAQKSSSQPAQTQATSSSSDEQNLSAHQPLEPQTREGFWGHLNPFARKRFVRRQFDPIRNRMNELDELTAKNARDIRDADGRAQEGIRLASAKANEADMHAVDAGNRAQQAHQTAQQATSRLQTVEQTVSNLDQYQKVSDAEIRFRPGQNALSPKAKSALDEIADTLKGKNGYIVEVQGFSAGRGQAAIATSQNMADAVVRYLVINHEIPIYRIHRLGLGNVALKDADGNVRRIRGGRVEVSLMKNSVADLTSAQPSSSPIGAMESGQTPSSSKQNSSTVPAPRSNPNSVPQSTTPRL